MSTEPLVGWRINKGVVRRCPKCLYVLEEGEVLREWYFGIGATRTGCRRCFRRMESFHQQCAKNRGNWPSVRSFRGTQQCVSRLTCTWKELEELER